MFIFLICVLTDQTHLEPFQQFGNDVIIPKIEITGAAPHELLQFLADQSQLELVMLDHYEQKVDLSLEKVALPAILHEIAKKCQSAWAIKDGQLFFGSLVKVTKAIQ